MNENQNTKQKFLRILVVITVLIIVLLLSGSIIFDYLDNKDSSRHIVITEAHLPLDNVDPKEIWVDQIRSENHLIRSENNQIRNENEIVQEKVDFIQEMVVNKLKEDNDREKTVQNEILELRKTIEALKSEIKNTSSVTSKINLQEELRTTSVTHKQGSLIDPFFNQSNFEESVQRYSQEIVVPLTSVVCSEPISLRHVDRTIPAGTTVKAILLSSVDMPCGVRGSIDPLPVKLRVIADGRLPNNVKARLKGGIITASVYGELSSERVNFRLEKLTQIRPDGHYIETQVAGYVSGEDGKYGLRGVVVDKSAHLIENALISGFFSGVSNFFEAAATARLFPLTSLNGCSPEGCQAPNWGQSMGQLGIAGGSEGVTSALDAVTDYFIKRAEQLRPVIQISPGRLVDITFLDSADLGDLYTHEKVRNSGSKDLSCGY